MQTSFKKTLTDSTSSMPVYTFVDEHDQKSGKFSKKLIINNINTRYKHHLPRANTSATVLFPCGVERLVSRFAHQA
jgi:hypothetical protein